MIFDDIPVVDYARMNSRQRRSGKDCRRPRPAVNPRPSARKETRR